MQLDNATILCEEPKVIVYHDVFSKEECDEITSSNIPFERSKGYSYEKEDSTLTDYRTSFTYHDMKNDFRFITYRCLELAKSHFWFMSFDESHFEKIQFQRYDVGQEYQPHYDYFNHPGYKQISNDRIATMITYLNDDFEGGSTYFIKLALEVKPVKGSVLFFDYKYIHELNYQTEHAGLPVTKGQKTIATSWIRRLPYKRSE